MSDSAHLSLFAAERYRPYLTPDDYAQLLNVLNQPAYPAVRVNLLKNPDHKKRFPAGANATAGNQSQ
jgi:hypothetical protein